MDTTISPSEAKSAREALRLSQSKTGAAVNLNRAYLSQFENGRYLLTDDDNEKLRLYYESEGYDFNDTSGQDTPYREVNNGLEEYEWIDDGFIVSGVWAWCRHPNYLGEVGFWWGIFLFALAAGWTNWWTIVGPIAMTVLFVGISVPLMDRRMRRRPGYAEHVERVPALIPRPPR